MSHSKETILSEIESLNSKLTGGLSDENFEILAKIRLLQAELNQVDTIPQKPDNSQFECFNCGS
jgi:hypothetical protein